VSLADAQIAHINLAREFRGGERQTLLLMAQLSARGWTQRLVARRSSELADRIDLLGLPGTEVVRVDGNPVAWVRATRGTRITHAHEARGVYVGLLGRWFSGTRGVITRRVPHALKSSWLRDRAYVGADQVVTVSNAIAYSVRARYPALDALTIHDAHAHLPSDPDRVAAIRARYPDRFLVAHTGSYVDRTKGQMTLIEVARRAAAEGLDWHFLLMGSGMDEARFREAIGPLTNVELAGFVDNVGDYLAASDAFAFPSRVEGLGSSLLDALQFGLPVVATRVGGIPELIEDGINGILIDPDAPDQLYDGIRRLAAGGPDVERMRAVNPCKAGQFDADAMADAYETVYRRLLA